LGVRADSDILKRNKDYGLINVNKFKIFQKKDEEEEEIETPMKE
jgi:hypothetical protein